MAQWSETEARKLIRKAKADKEASDSVYREAMELTFPDRENFVKRAEGEQKAQYNWDSSATVSVIRAANRLSSDFTPQFQDWLEIGLGAAAQHMPEEAFRTAMGGKTKDAVKTELEGITAVVQAVFDGPGFPTASNELYIDWHYGQGGMAINDGDVEPIVFSSMPMSHFYAYEGANGRLDRWFFWHEKRADVIMQEWPDAKLHEDLAKLAAMPDAKPVELCAIVYRDEKEAREKFRYEVFWVKGNACHRIVERTSRTAPMVTPRYAKLPGENRGRGPVLFALPDIRTANKIIELTLRSVAVAVAGVYTATENGVVGNAVKIAPYSIIQVRSNGGPNGPSLQRLDNPQRIDFGQLVLDTLHENIKKIIGDNSLPSEAGPIRTATEFVQRARELISDQAGGLGRLRGEFIIPAVQRVIDILERKQILPTDGLTIDQFLIEVRMTSPLAKSEAMAEVESIVRFIEMMKMIIGDQGLAIQMNLDRTFTIVADLMAIPMKVRNTAEERQAVEKGLTQAAAAQAGADPAAAGAAYDQSAAKQQENAP